MTKKEQFDAAKEFARRVIQAMWDGNVDGGDMQDWAQELGLIYLRKATVADAAAYPDIIAGENMFEFERWMAALTAGKRSD